MGTDCFENVLVFTQNWSVKYWDTDYISSTVIKYYDQVFLYSA